VSCLVSKKTTKNNLWGKSMLPKKFLSVLAIVSTSVTLTANATPILGLDLDIGTAGIQSTLSVTEGDIFTFDLVAFDDGTPTTPILVDTVAINLLSLPGSGTATFGGATAGAFAALLGPPGLGAFDFGDTIPTDIDPSLAPLLVPPISPFSLGSFSYGSPGLPALLSISTLPAAMSVDTFDVLMSFEFTAITAGEMFFDVLGFPPGSELLFSGAPTPGGSLFPTLLGPSTLSIMASTPPPPPPTGIPEPGTIALLAFGLAGLMGRKKYVN
jgi:hypothetical protein